MNYFVLLQTSQDCVLFYYMTKKTSQDCVWHYYQTKKIIGKKRLVEKPGQKQKNVGYLSAGEQCGTLDVSVYYFYKII